MVGAKLTEENSNNLIITKLFSQDTHRDASSTMNSLFEQLLNLSRNGIRIEILIIIELIISDSFLYFFMLLEQTPTFNSFGLRYFLHFHITLMLSRTLFLSCA